MTCRVVIFKATGYGYGKSCFINALYSQKAHAVFFINIEWNEQSWRGGETLLGRGFLKRKMQSYYIIS